MTELNSTITVDAARVALVTGGSSGIGEAIALEFAKSGYRVAISGRDKQRLDTVIGHLKSVSPFGDSDDVFFGCEANFEDMQQVDGLIEKVIEKFHKLDVLVNNAGYVGQSLDLMEPDFFSDFQNILQVNLMAAIRLSQLAAPYLMRSPRGVLLNVSSVLDRIATPNLAYCVSKAGLSMLTKTLANELEGTPVRVVAVAPGPISTRISPLIDTLAPTTLMARLGSPREVAEVVKFLESEKASYVHGSTIDIDGGYLARLPITAGPYQSKREARTEFLKGASE